MRIPHANVLGAVLVVGAGGCFGGTGSGLVGTSGGDGGTGNGAAVLDFFVQPNTANVRQVISPPVEVVVRDSLGSIDSAFTATITIELGSNSTGAALSGTTSVRPTNGIATFSNLAVSEAGTYTLQAASGAVSVTSSAFTITTATEP